MSSLLISSNKKVRFIPVPDDFCWDPVTKTFGDPTARPEIRHATVEFIAPAEYMVSCFSLMLLFG